jgi:integrase
MSSVYRKRSPKTGKHLPNWYCTFRIPDSSGELKQVHRSTGQHTKGEAEKAARLFEEESLREAGAGNEISAAILGRVKEASELAMKRRLNPAHARRIIGEIMALQGTGDDLAEHSVRSWVEEWLKEKGKHTKASTLEFYRGATGMFLQSLGPKADAHLEAVSTRDVKDFRDSLRAVGRTAKTANHKLRALKSCFEDARKESVILRNPLDPIKPLDEDDSTEREPFTPEEVDRLLTAAPSAEWYGAMVLSAYTGLRISDCASFRAENIVLQEGLIQVTPQKASRKRKGKSELKIPMHPELKAFFAKNKPSPFPNTPLFPSLDGRKPGGPVGPKTGLSAEFNGICEAAGVDRILARSKEDDAPRNVYRKGFHSFRHSCTSWLANAGVPDDVRMAITGHSDKETHGRYTHHSLGTLKDAVDKLPGLDGKTKRA